MDLDKEIAEFLKGKKEMDNLIAEIRNKVHDPSLSAEELVAKIRELLPLNQVGRFEGLMNGFSNVKI